ncbi:hypothetical protein, partial [Oceanicella actignis]|uniref:hypothetical protein n=1 Tax=Oceanicella actignis TaxID=1189325 RepID=UPI001B875850
MKKIKLSPISATVTIQTVDDGERVNLRWDVTAGIDNLMSQSPTHNSTGGAWYRAKRLTRMRIWAISSHASELA